MSPSRTRRQFVPARPRSEVIAAVVVASSIVVGTVLLIWLLRPGPRGVPGGGGLFARQPRMTILVVLAAAALGTLIVRVRRGRHLRFGERTTLLVGSGLVLVLAIVAGIAWPGGVVRHWPKRPKIADIPPATSIPPSSTPVPSSTIVAPPTTPASAASSAPPTTKG